MTAKELQSPKQRTDSGSSAPRPIQVLDQEGRLKASTDLGITNDQILSAYKSMVLARTLDEKMIALQRQGRMGTYVSCSGQEASQVGCVLALKETDWIFPYYRDLGMVIQRGVPLDSVVNKLFGNGEDVFRGRDLPNAYGWRQYRMFTLAAPIASHLQVAVGFATAARYRKDNLVALTSFGDGATSSGEFHVSMNFAGVFKAPVVFVCENNQYAISVPSSRQTASESIAIKSIAYGFDGILVDGNDLLSVFKTVRESVEKARRDGGPTLVECLTYRLGAHSTADDWKKYRASEEVEEWKRKDPLVRVKLFLMNKGTLNEAEDAAFRKKIESSVYEAIAKGEKIPPPSLHSMFEDVYSKVPSKFEEEFKELTGESK